MSVLKIKDQNGQWTDVLSIKGEKGDNGQDYVLTENDKQEIAQDVAELVDIPVDDVQINGATIVNNGVANIPVGNGIKITNGAVSIAPATSARIKQGIGDYSPVVSATQHESTFYGLAKAAGDTTQSASSNAIGTYTDEAKSAIQTMLDVPSKNDIPEVNVDDVQIDGTSVVNNGVAEIPVATSSNLGAVQVINAYGLQSNYGNIAIFKASTIDCQDGSNSFKPIVPSNQHEATFYGLAKSAGDTTQSQSSNAVGTYTDEAKASIQSMLGVPSEDKVITDVQIDGTSIVTDGVAGIPVATLPTTGTDAGNLGLICLKNYRGIAQNRIDQSLYIDYPTTAQVKNGNDTFRPVTTAQQHTATFYGLAKAAGSDEKDSTLPVGQYTESAQTAIKQMLGVKDNYDSLVVEVSGTDPVITGKASYRYNCGELYTLSITPPESGTMDIIFTSGATPTVLTLPNTVKMPDWWAGIEINTTYEMCITDGVYCGVMSWAT